MCSQVKKKKAGVRVKPITTVKGREVGGRRSANGMGPDIWFVLKRKKYG